MLPFMFCRLVCRSACVYMCHIQILVCIYRHLALGWVRSCSSAVVFGCSAANVRRRAASAASSASILSPIPSTAATNAGPWTDHWQALRPHRLHSVMPATTHATPGIVSLLTSPA